MNVSPELYTAFSGQNLLAQGPLEELLPRLAKAREQDSSLSPLIFRDATGERIEIDWRDPLPLQIAKIEQEKSSIESPQEPSPPRTGPGRPKLGVVAREVTLLPRHWEWLASQPGGASVALRKLVETARKANAQADQARRSLEAAHRFMSLMGGDLPGFEAASRALFAADFAQVRREIRNWPEDLRKYAIALIGKAEQDTLSPHQGD